MDITVLAFLLQDAVQNGAIYVLMGIGIVLVFTVTRIVFVSFGDLIAYSSITLAFIQLGRLPGTIWLLLTLAALGLAMELYRLIGVGGYSKIPKVLLLYLGLPLIPIVLTILLVGRDLSPVVEVLLAIGLVLPIGPLLYRTVFQPIASSSGLVLLMAAVALHFALAGLALLFFGPEGFRTKPYASGVWSIGISDIPLQMIIVVASAIILATLLYAFFERTVQGKILRATAINRVGARLVGISTTQAGSFAFLLAALIAAVAGVLIGPVTIIYYDTGFLIGLKGFVAAVFGGFITYPMAVFGALLIALIETFSAFYWSQFKDVIVFLVIIPVLFVRALLAARGSVEEHEVDE